MFVYFSGIFPKLAMWIVLAGIFFKRVREILFFKFTRLDISTNTSAEITLDCLLSFQQFLNYKMLDLPNGTLPSSLRII